MTMDRHEDYRFISPPQDIRISGAIMPLRDLATMAGGKGIDNDWRVLRGEDPAFLREFAATINAMRFDNRVLPSPVEMDAIVDKAPLLSAAIALSSAANGNVWVPKPSNGSFPTLTTPVWCTDAEYSRLYNSSPARFVAAAAGLSPLTTSDLSAVVEFYNNGGELESNNVRQLFKDASKFRRLVGAAPVSMAYSAVMTPSSPDIGWPEETITGGAYERRDLTGGNYEWMTGTRAASAYVSKPAFDDTQDARAFHEAVFEGSAWALYGVARVDSSTMTSSGGVISSASQYAAFSFLKDGNAMPFGTDFMPDISVISAYGRLLMSQATFGTASPGGGSVYMSLVLMCDVVPRVDLFSSPYAIDSWQWPDVDYKATS